MSGLKWKIGNVEVYQIAELDAGTLIQRNIKQATPNAIKEINWLNPNFADGSGHLKGLVQAFLVKSNGKRILIDGCNGNDKTRTSIPKWSRLKTDFIEKLNALSVQPTDVDAVVCTHLHCDHVGWNTKLENKHWVPTFPNAKYFFGEEEYNYWQESPEKENVDHKAAFADSVFPIMDNGSAKLVSFDFAIDPSVKLFRSKGHTPGHLSISIKSKGQSAIISGDFIHHPCQIAFPDWSADADTFPSIAIETRKSILSQIAGTDAILIGSHFADPVAGKVVKANSGFAFSIGQGEELS